MKNFKDYLIVFAVALCLTVGLNRVYKFYKESQSPYAVGECFEISDPQFGTIKFHVVDTNNTKREMNLVAEVEIFEGAKMNIPVEVSYKDIRDSDSRKVDCK